LRGRKNNLNRGKGSWQDIIFYFIFVPLIIFPLFCHSSLKTNKKKDNTKRKGGKEKT
jgi:hypothetical protein